MKKAMESTMSTTIEENGCSVKVAPESDWRLRRRQLATAASPLLLTFVAGLSYFHGVPPDTLMEPSMVATTYRSEYDSTFVDAFWILPGNVLPLILSSLVSGVLMDKFGRKLVLVFTYPLFIAGWLTIGCTSTPRYSTIGRLICSIPVGTISPLAPVYISEVSDPRFRGTLLAMVNVSLYLGMLISAYLGLLMDEKPSAWICAVISFVGWCVSLACRESPIWSMNSEHADLEQWVYLRGWKSLSEFRAIVREIKRETEKRLGEDSGRCAQLKDKLFSRNILWPLAIACVLFFTWHFSGFHEMAIVVGRPIQFLVFGQHSVLLAILLTGLMYFVVIVVGSILVARYRRRTVAMVSVIGACVSSLFASIFCFLNPLPFLISYLFTVCMLIFLSIGLLPLTLVFAVELFPRSARGAGAGLVFAFSWACALVDAKMGPWILQHWTMPSVAMFYAIVMAIGALFLCWKLPETKDKTLLEIETIFDGEVRDLDPAGIELVNRGT